MIAVSIQYSNVFQPPVHFALPPLPTNDFELARQYAMNYMQQNVPLALNVTYHFVRDDWQYQNESQVPNQESKAFSLN